MASATEEQLRQHWRDDPVKSYYSWEKYRQDYLNAGGLITDEAGSDDVRQIETAYGDLFGFLQEAAKLPPEAQAGRSWILDLLRQGTPSFPRASTTGLSPLERYAQEQILGPMVRGESFRDPRTSPYYQGFREESEQLQEKEVGDIRRRHQLTGMGGSGASQRAEAEYRSGTSSKILSVLGGMYEAESARDNPMTRMAAAMQWGGAEREAKETNRQREYQRLLAEMMFPYQTLAPMAGQLANLPSIPQDQWNWMFMQNPQEEKEGSDWGGILKLIATIAGAYFTGGASGAMPMATVVG